MLLPSFLTALWSGRKKGQQTLEEVWTNRYNVFLITLRHNIVTSESENQQQTTSDRAQSKGFSSEFLHPRFWPTWCALSVIWLAAKLPIAMQHAIGRILGQLAYLVMRSRRHITQTNIRLCFPHLSHQQQQRLVRRTFESQGIGLIEAASGWFSDINRYRTITTVSGLEHLEQAQRSGRGVILLGGHYSTLDLGGCLFNLFANAGAMQRDHDNPLFNQVMSAGRQRFTKKLFGKHDLRGIIQWLNQGETLWYATDQDYGRRSTVFAPFFGIDTATLTTTSRIAQKTGAVVIPYHHYRSYRGQYGITFGKALENFPGTSVAEDARRSNQVLEAFIRLYPDQYLWLHRRFKTRPDKNTSSYYKSKRA